MNIELELNLKMLQDVKDHCDSGEHFSITKLLKRYTKKPLPIINYLRAAGALIKFQGEDYRYYFRWNPAHAVNESLAESMKYVKSPETPKPKQSLTSDEIDIKKWFIPAVREVLKHTKKLDSLDMLITKLATKESVEAAKQEIQDGVIALLMVEVAERDKVIATHCAEILELTNTTEQLIAHVNGLNLKFKTIEKSIVAQGGMVKPLTNLKAQIIPL